MNKDEQTSQVHVHEGMSYPSWSRSSWSAMSFRLTVASWLTFESPAFHHTLETLTDATKIHNKFTLTQNGWIS